eukprot:gnl/TRDRNA2_/TRDRNA2_146480_c3_seq2.p1 gnl/TRDRNA2_/TRDRNA2_146480_c3~~gnl/TRDRNA2_/TRDRNA2_146480_c3_seq2.p1  ORF type:complete len:108 (-),score=13.36 gnl/TRDRNA2_/TRDRNA2_146480_c3_seq2:439-762(-)
MSPSMTSCGKSLGEKCAAANKSAESAMAELVGTYLLSDVSRNPRNISSSLMGASKAEEAKRYGSASGSSSGTTASMVPPDTATSDPNLCTICAEISPTKGTKSPLER